MQDTFTVMESGDGSKTLYSEYFQETYHSIHGAITESMHVFIHAGLKQCTKSTIHVLEIGFGTGLNAWLTALESILDNKNIHYISYEKFPLCASIWEQFQFPDHTADQQNLFKKIHTAVWNSSCQILNTFELLKVEGDIVTSILPNNIDILYFDAFSPNVQAELWSDNIFFKMYESLSPGGILVTYCAKGSVRRTLTKIGFKVERLPGPPPKREMLRATK